MTSACFAAGAPQDAMAACPTPADAYSQAVLADAPADYYRLDEGPNQPMCDASAAANDGAYSSGVTTGQAGGLTADAADAAVSSSGGVGQSNGNSGISGAQSYTLEGWFKGTVQQEEPLVDVGNAGQGQMAGLTLWPSDGPGCTGGSNIVLDEYQGTNCWDTTALGVHLYDGNWHYLAVTYDASGGQLNAYVDGRSLGSQQPPVTLSPSASPVRIGWWIDPYNEHPLAGSADEVAVYPTALTAGRVAAHYAAAGYTATSGDTWDLAHDFVIDPAAQANPQPDGYGNAGTWSFLEQTASPSLPTDPAQYAPLPKFDGSCFGPGTGLYLDGTCGQATDTSGQGIAVNKSGSTITTSTSASLPTGLVGMYPLSNNWVIVAWRSPITGSVTVNGVLTPQDTGDTSHARTWALLLATGAGATTAAKLESGTLLGSAPSVSFGKTSSPIPVSVGNMLYVLVGPGPGDDFTYDSTGLTLTVQQVPAGSATSGGSSGGESGGAGAAGGQNAGSSSGGNGGASSPPPSAGNSGASGAGSQGVPGLPANARPPVVKASYQSPADPAQFPSFAAGTHPTFTTGDQVFADGTCADGGSGASACEFIDMYGKTTDQIFPSDGSFSGAMSGLTSTARFTAAGVGQHTLSLWAIDGTRADSAHVELTYTVVAPPPRAQQATSDSRALGSGTAASVPPICGGIVIQCRLIRHNGVTVGEIVMDTMSGAASLYPLGGAQVINAGGANVINAGGANVINAGGANVINAGGANLIELVYDGQAVAVGAGLIGNGGASLISDKGLGLIGNAGGALISDQGSGLIGNDGASLISDKGLGLFGGPGTSLLSTNQSPLSVGYGSFASSGLLQSTASLISDQGAGLIGNDGASLISDKGLGLIGNAGGALIGNAGGAFFARDVASAAAAKPRLSKKKLAVYRLASGTSVVPGRGARGSVTMLFGTQGQKLLSAVGKINLQRKAHHERLLRIVLVIATRFKPSTGAPAVTKLRTVLITPLAAQAPKPKAKTRPKIRKAQLAQAGRPVRFSLVSAGGTPQFAYYLVEAAGHRPPRARDWFSATSTVTPGQATASVAPGQTVYFNRTMALGQRAPDGMVNPPEGVSGIAYHVTARTPSVVRVVMPSAGAEYQPGLSQAERRLLGQLNARRRARGLVPLAISTTLDKAASAQARDEALHHRWPDPYFYAVNQSFGWPGDTANETFAEADAPYANAARVLEHWDGDRRDRESPNIWRSLSDPSLRYAGIADGGGAWIIEAVAGCPDPADLRACGLTGDTGS